MVDTVTTRRCEYFEKGKCNIFCLLRSKKYGMKPKYFGDGIIDYSECDVIKKLNKNRIKRYAF